MAFYLSLILIVLCMIMSLQTLFSSTKIKGRWVSMENFLYLISLYATIMIGFGLIYILLDLHGLVVLIDGTNYIEAGFLERLETGFYFSAVTLFSVGYGDISPIGIGRMIAVLEALIGYVIPAAFVARVVFDVEKQT
ncbi:two pore domain potassium channel family protein [Bacillus sp. ISL-47]|uniref:potassium channel family protein n=1 Tax=Bacillus sp. ISL-47 TaxID=2819130 RepID=UPI001BEBF0C3|nr:potassium channel family protein [Bacillus sp. ISL-47]MBT2688850.1 two pore domain potassium channel family protein [Bacillus sp. ISL-47]MBT2710763.1 two pore domain potassium channel family protein [Pseudomonas sp. ISL-84]